MESAGKKQYIDELIRAQDALQLQNMALQNKIESLDNEYRFEIDLLRRNNKELRNKTFKITDYSKIEKHNKHLQGKVHKYKLEIIKKNGEINGLIYENKKLYDLSLKQIPPPLSSSSQENQREVSPVYEEQEKTISGTEDPKTFIRLGNSNFHNKNINIKTQRTSLFENSADFESSKSFNHSSAAQPASQKEVKDDLPSTLPSINKILSHETHIQPN
ncbi:hypothetical protein QEN19_000636 [Hanseniaspora menglaensis]